MNLKKTKLTFNEWKEHGYVVMAGEKSKERNKEGVAVFSFDQVTENVDISHEDEYDWENDPLQDPHIFN